LHIAETAVIAVRTGKNVEEIAKYVGFLIVVCCGKIGNWENLKFYVGPVK
jgi:hypothetical protein